MQSIVKVVHKQYEGIETYSVPVMFKIIIEGRTTIYDCKVDLPREELPEWLTVTEFQIPHVYTPGNPGVTMTAFGDVKGIGNIDTAIFVAEVEASISVCEKNTLL